MSKHRRTTGALRGPTARRARQPKGQQEPHTSARVPGTTKYVGLLAGRLRRR